MRATSGNNVVSIPVEYPPTAQRPSSRCLYSRRGDRTCPIGAGPSATATACDHRPFDGCAIAHLLPRSVEHAIFVARGERRGACLVVRRPRARALVRRERTDE